jgi:hypothetical protein
MSSVASQVTSDCQAFNALRESLRVVFGADVELWCHDGCWQRVSGPEVGERALGSVEFSAQLDRVRERGSDPVCIPSSGGLSCLIVPLRWQRRALVAAVQFSDASPSLLLSLARLFVKQLSESEELDRLRLEHQEFLRQVTHDFEELTFLRCMSRLLEISDLSFDFTAMAETMLTTLKPLLDADSLVLLGGDFAAKPPEVCCWSGLRDVSEETCIRLVTRFRDAAKFQPVVRNHFDRVSESADLSSVHSFILVPIVNAETTVGWLVALNRNNEHAIQLCDLPWGLSYLEFGTHEATLMTSSAAILATHARNIGLFRQREELLVRVARGLVSALGGQDERVSGTARGQRLADELGSDAKFCESLYLSGSLHEIGKIDSSN